MLLVGFTLAKELRISPLDLDKMDFAQVRFLNDALIQHYQKVNEKIKNQSHGRTHY